MAPRLPDRYETRIRLGRDGDVEEWLATDTSLDRPVLVRILDPKTGEKRRRQFIEAAKAAASAHHVGLSEVYAVGDEENPYAVVEWHGGVTVADRLRAGETLTVTEFLAMGPRLASGLAALHAAGGVHGAIDTAAVGFAGGLPAKLGAFGRRPRDMSRREDTAALAAALRVSVTGTDIAGIRPSQVAEGLPHAVDDVLLEAEQGSLTASRLAAALRAHRPAEVAEPRSRWTWTWTVVSAALIVSALVLSAVGVAIDVDPGSPFLFPAVPADAQSPPPIVGEPPPAAPSEALAAEPAGYDPGGGGTFPNVDDLTNVIDSARSTTWRTDVYGSPPGESQPGIGIRFTVAGTPRFLQLIATPGTAFEILWSEGLPETREGWEHVFSGTVLAGANDVRLPPRTGGIWLLWLTDLPEAADARYYSEVSTVAFLP